MPRPKEFEACLKGTNNNYAICNAGWKKKTGLSIQDWEKKHGASSLDTAQKALLTVLGIEEDDILAVARDQYEIGKVLKDLDIDEDLQKATPAGLRWVTMGSRHVLVNSKGETVGLPGVYAGVKGGTGGGYEDDSCREKVV
jgi:hypothetical protein